jgi:hypothetical protein
MLNVRIVFLDAAIRSSEDSTILEEAAPSMFMVEDGGSRPFLNVGTRYKLAFHFPEHCPTMISFSMPSGIKAGQLI